VAITWNPADLVNIALTNNNLSAARTSGTGVVRATACASAGKKYFEVSFDTLYGNTRVGFAASTFSLTSGLGGDVGWLSVGWGVGDSHLWDGQGYTNVDGWGTGVFGMGIDLATGNVQLWHNGTICSTNMPAATSLAGLAVFPAFSTDSYPTVTAVFTGTQYLPAGYTEFGAVADHGFLTQLLNGVITGIKGAAKSAIPYFDGSKWAVKEGGTSGQVLGIDTNGDINWVAQSGGSGALGNTESGFAPYLICGDSIPTTAGLQATFPAISAAFPSSGPNATVISVSLWSHTFTPSKVSDVWLDSTGAITYYESALNAYSDLPRFDTKLLLYRVQTNAAAIEGVYPTFSYYPVRLEPPKKFLTADLFQYNMVIPSYTHTWVSGAQHEMDDVILTSAGDLWRVVAYGTLGTSEPATPLTNGAFKNITSGLCLLDYVGDVNYIGAWKESETGGIMWYFSSIAAGLMAKALPAEVKTYLQTAIKFAAWNWQAITPYQAGMLVGGVYTSGRLWQCTTAGTSDVAANFPSSATAGTTTYADGTAAWLCVDVYSGSAQWFWKDYSPLFGIVEEDSHDSYASCLIWAIAKYLEATGDTAWLSQTSPHAAYTYGAAIKEILYANIITQVDGTSGLINTFQGNIRSDGWAYAEQYLMDNCEDYAGLAAAIELYNNYLGDAAYAAYLQSYQDNLLIALEGLYDNTNFCYSYAFGADMAAAGTSALFYPWVMSQLWPALWNVPLDTKRYKTAIDWADTKFPIWWARTDSVTTLSLGAHLGLSYVTKDGTIVSDIMRRINEHHLFEASADTSVDDFAYYLTLKAMLISTVELASASMPGIAQLATADEVLAGAAPNKIVTPATLQSKLDAANFKVLVDFGVYQDSVTTTVPAPWITANSIILCTPACSATPDHDPEDAFVEGLQCYPANIVPGVSFDIVTYAPNGTWGRYYINAIEA